MKDEKLPKSQRRCAKEAEKVEASRGCEVLLVHCAARGESQVRALQGDGGAHASLHDASACFVASAAYRAGKKKATILAAGD